MMFQHGGRHVERMKALAATGQDSATFISKFSKADYARRHR